MATTTKRRHSVVRTLNETKAKPGRRPKKKLGKNKIVNGHRTFDGYEHYEFEKEKYIIDRIREAYKKQGWTVSLLSEWCGVSTTYLYWILNGSARSPSTMILHKITFALGLRLEARKR